ncbi:MAG: GspE/PulE family protein [Candidatus Dojkabacteria bacterium]|nr:GspE/PulE family protein [Candidatus Dojkabacteria bacterium]
MKFTNRELKELIEEGGVLETSVLRSLLKEADKKSIDLQDYLVEKNLLTDEQIGQLIAAKLDVPFATLQKKSVDEKVLNIIPKVLAQKQKAIAFEEDKYTLKVASPNPLNIQFFHVLQKKTGKDVVPYYITERDFKNSLNKYKQGLYAEFDDLIKQTINKASREESSETPIVEMLNLILDYAHENTASDIHIEPTEEEVLIRFRIDGILHTIIKMPKQIEDRIVSRVKVVAKLRTDEHNSAQDGRFMYKSEDEKVDIRVSVLPIAWGEKVVMRLLSSKNKFFALSELGLAEEDLVKVRTAITRPHGMVLATGPTGCGKTTTLYAILKLLNKKEVNISTIEDPIEYSVQGVNQVQVNPKTNLTFAEGLKSLLRQDPDILMVGEIRDEETARIAVNAAMTGHLVLSTLHTNDSATTLPRFTDMGIKAYLIASTVNLVIAQRLVRRICPQCIQSRSLTKEEVDLYGKIFSKFSGKEDIGRILVYEGKGCNSCNKTGYSGRTGIYEVLIVDEGIRKVITKKEATRGDIQKEALSKGMTTMFEDGIRKVLMGVTSIEEVVRVSEI